LRLIVLPIKRLLGRRKALALLLTESA
jgi:hypothetical protein